jgi:hypothetical protein
MITLYQPPPAWGLPSISPFCVKLETYLRMAKIEYRSAKASIVKAPKGRMPYVDIEGKLFGDSTLIINLLKEKFGDPLDCRLTSEQKAQSLLLQRTTEDHLLYSLAWLRWSDEESWFYVHAYFKKLMPPVIGAVIIKLMRKGMLKNLSSHGIGDHTRDLYGVPWESPLKQHAESLKNLKNFCDTMKKRFWF